MDGTRLRIALLGELTATRDGVPLELGGPRQRAVLALLLLARGEVVPAYRLIESLWGDDPPPSAHGALQSYVSHLRRRLQPDSAARGRSGVITSEGPGYAARLPEDAVDAWRFEALLRRAAQEADPVAAAALLTEALELWHGPALLEYAGAPWAMTAVARLDDLRATAREQLLAARLACGEAALLVPELEEAITEQPLREERWRLLVLALYRAQRQADALAALRRARATLAEELGVDPGPALRALEAEVLAQSPALDLPAQRRAPASGLATPRPTTPGPATVGPTPAAPTPLGPAPVGPAPGPARDPSPLPTADDLVDRDRETAALRRALDALGDGEPGLVVVEGPAGIGKTRLLAEARRDAVERGWRVLTARGSPLEGAFGFGAVRQLFEPELVQPQRSAALLGGAAASARGVFDIVDGEPADGSFAVLHGLYWLTVNLTADGPLVLVVDDLQWCDGASLRCLAYLARRLDGLPVLVLGSVRTGEQHDDEELLAALAHEDAAVVVRPTPLSPGATGELVRRRLGPAAPSFVQACHRTTSGNPLLLRQLLRALETERVRPDAAHADTVMAVGSRAVSSMVLRRLRRLPPDATAVGRAVAVLGEGAQLPVVASLVALPEDRTAAALAALVRAEVVQDEQPLRFVHPLVRDAVYRDLPAAERSLRHEAAAALLRRLGAPDEQVAAHLLLAPCRADRDNVVLLRRAARTAADRGAPDSAVTYLRRALQEPPSGDELTDVLLEVGLVESLVDGPASSRHLLEAHARLDDACARGEVAIAIARTHVFASPPGVATAFAREAAAALPAELTDQRQGLLALERISGFMQGLDPAVWRAAPAPPPTGRGHGARMLAATLAWETSLDGTERARCVELARTALHRDRLWQVDNGLFWVVAAACRMLAEDDLGDFWDRARAEAHARGSLFAALSTNLWQGYDHWRRGELDEALRCFGAALEQDRMWGGTGIGQAYTRAFTIGCHLDRGDVAAARQSADEALAAPAGGEGARLLHQAHARLLVAEDRPADALAALAAARTPTPIENPVWNPWRSTSASALHLLGRADEAVTVADEHVAALRRWGAPAALGAGLRLLGELRAGAGLEHLREAVALLEPTTAALERARARCALGASADVVDEEALPVLRSAVVEAAACGAADVRDRAVQELERRGCCPPVPLPDGRSVSRTSRRIVDLTVAGLDVRDIAQQLCLTPGAVQSALEDAGAGAAR